MSGDAEQRLEGAAALLQAGRVGQAIGALREIVAGQPTFAPGHELLATALERSGDRVGAENALRACLAADPRHAAAATKLAESLTARHQAREAITLLSPMAEDASDAGLLSAYGAALRSEGRNEESVRFYERAQKATPDSPESEHNLAAALGDADRLEESLQVVQRAFAKGLDAPETWLVQGRSQSGLGQFDEAETSFREAIKRRPNYVDAHRDLAQLIWMRTEDLEGALHDLDAALRVSPSDTTLILAKAKLLEYAVGQSAAYAVIADHAAQRGHDVAVQIAAAGLALFFDPDLALRHAEIASTVAPGNAAAQVTLCQANLGVGRPGSAARIAEQLMADWPQDQQPVALAAVAWRMLGDPRYGDFYDYDRLVRGQTLDTPAGWSTLDAYLSDLATSLRDLQRFRGHPIGQSLRYGAQTGQSLTRSDDPAIKAFFTAIDRPIKDYIGVLSERDDLLGRRVTAGYRFTGAWSVMLRPGGHHVDHIHQLGWISSAFHVELPSAVATEHQGWLKFGEPGLPTQPPLAAEHFVKPMAGTLVLFPSYMWHGTVPFQGDAPRLSIAFDVVPA